MRALVLTICLLTGLFVMMSVAYAGPYEYTGPWVGPEAGDYIPATWLVSGKEYSDSPNKDASEPPVLDPMQTLHWDGLGGRENGVDFGDSGQIDALAFHNDALFSELIANQTAMICSLSGDVAWNGTTVDSPLLWEKTTGTQGVWATDTYIDQESVNDLDGIDLWHSETGIAQDSTNDGTDVDRYSLADDPGGVAVFNAAGGTVFTDAELAAAIADQLSLNASQESELATTMDVDALMDFNDSTLLFSIEALNITGYSFVGDEVWVYDDTAGTVVWLAHGGHDWDTNWLGLDVDGLEAVPEPTTAALLLLGGIVAVFRRRK